MKYTRKMNRTLLWVGFALFLISGLIWVKSTENPDKSRFNTVRMPNRYDTMYVYDDVYLDITNVVRAKFDKLPYDTGRDK